MAKLKLTYFDFHGGRGEPARIALSMGGIPYEDDRVKGTDWERRKPDTPFGRLASAREGRRDPRPVERDQSLCGPAHELLSVRPLAGCAMRRDHGGGGGHHQ